MPSDKDRLQSCVHNGQTYYPVLDTTPGHEALIIFFEDADSLVELYPDAMPIDELPAILASSEMFVASRNNYDVLMDRDLVSVQLPIAQGVAWIPTGNQIIDAHSHEPVLTLADNQYTEANAKLICNGRAALHLIYGLFSILQREAVFDPTRYPDFIKSIQTTLRDSGHTNVTEIL